MRSCGFHFSLNMLQRVNGDSSNGGLLFLCGVNVVETLSNDSLIDVVTVPDYSSFVLALHYMVQR